MKNNKKKNWILLFIYRYGVECLFRFYTYGIEKHFRQHVFEDFQQETLCDHEAGNKIDYTQKKKKSVNNKNNFSI